MNASSTNDDRQREVGKPRAARSTGTLDRSSSPVRSFKRTITITCPAWCEEDPDHHVDELWNQDGHCLHQSRTVWVDDPTGFQRWPDGLKPHESIEVRLCASQTPDGKLTESPVMMVDHREVSIEQAEALATTLLRVVAAYRDGATV